MFIHCRPLETHFYRLMLAEVKLTLFSVVPRRVDQIRIYVENHLCYACQKQGNFKAMEVGKGVIEFTARVHVDLFIRVVRLVYLLTVTSSMKARKR